MFHLMPATPPDPYLSVERLNGDPWQVLDLVLPTVHTALLYGPPARGKSYAAEKLGLDGRRVHTVTLTRDSEADRLTGHYLPTGSGAWRWQDGPGTAAWRGGDRLVINEIDKATGDAADALHVLLDRLDTAEMTLPRPMLEDPPGSGAWRVAQAGEAVPELYDGDGNLVPVRLETVRPMPRTQIICTTNVDPEELSDAVLSRLPVRFRLDAVNPAAIAALPADLARVAAADVLPECNLRVPDIRTLHAFAKLRDEVGGPAAAIATVGPERAGDFLASLLVAARPPAIVEPAPAPVPAPDGYPYEQMDCPGCGMRLNGSGVAPDSDGDVCLSNVCGCEGSGGGDGAPAGYVRVQHLCGAPMVAANVNAECGVPCDDCVGSDGEIDTYEAVGCEACGWWVAADELPAL